MGCAQVNYQGSSHHGHSTKALLSGSSPPRTISYISWSPDGKIYPLKLLFRLVYVLSLIRLTRRRLLC